MSLKQRLSRWVRKELDLVPSATKFTLRSIDVDGRDTLIETVKVPDKLPDTKMVSEELALALLDRAGDNAKAQFGVARFELRALAKGEGIRSRFQFVLRGEAKAPLDPNSPIESEPANTSGLIGQTMRHNEAIMRMMLETVGGLVDSVKAENEALRARVAQGENVWVEQRVKLEELIDRSSKRKLEEAVEMSSVENKNAVVRQIVTQVVPALAQHVPGIMQSIGLLGPGQAGETEKKSSGSGEGEGKSSPDLRQKMREILTSLPQEKAMEFFNSLPPEKQKELAEILG